MFGYARAASFWVGMAVSTTLVALLLLLMIPFPFLVRQRFSRIWPAFNIWWLRVTCGLDYRLEGAENIPQGAAVYLCKHQSAWETVVMEQVLPPMVWVLKRELMWIPVFGWGIATLRPIAINRSRGRQAVEQMLEQGKERLDDGISVVVFPEGTRVAPGQKGKYRIGGALLAEKAGYPVVPIAHNAGYYWPKHGFRKRPGTIRMVIGPAIETEGLSAAQINARAEEWIENKVAELGGPQ